MTQTKASVKSKSLHHHRTIRRSQSLTYQLFEKMHLLWEKCIFQKVKYWSADHRIAWLKNDSWPDLLETILMRSSFSENEKSEQSRSAWSELKARSKQKWRSKAFATLTVKVWIASWFSTTNPLMTQHVVIWCTWPTTCFVAARLDEVIFSRKERN